MRSFRILIGLILSISALLIIPSNTLAAEPKLNIVTIYERHNLSGDAFATSYTISNLSKYRHGPSGKCEGTPAWQGDTWNDCASSAKFTLKTGFCAEIHTETYYHSNNVTPFTVKGPVSNKAFNLYWFYDQTVSSILIFKCG